MFLELIGFFLSSVLLAIVISFKFTSDIYPFALKKKLTRIALTNWVKSQPELVKTNEIYNPTCTEHLHILASDEERKLEDSSELEPNKVDELTFYGIDDAGNNITAQITKSFGNKANCLLHISIDGVKYSIFRHNVVSEPHGFSCGNFKLELVEPMRTWRVWYNGILEIEDENEDSVRLVHGTVNFLWKALESPEYSRKDISADLLANYLSRNGNFGANLTELGRILPEGYSQFGTLHGLIKIDGIEIPPLYLYGFRTRRPSSSSRLELDETNRLELFGMCGTDGNAFKLEGLNDGWTNGTIFYPSYKYDSIQNMNEDPSNFMRDNSLPKLFTMNDSTKAFRIEIWPKIFTQKFPGLEVTSLRLGMNGKEGRGLLLRRKLDKDCPPQQNLQNPWDRVISQASLEVHYAEIEIKAVSFESDLCLDVSLVGGKGASLAKLARITSSSREKNIQFKRAEGFCVPNTLFSSALPLEKITSIFSAAKTESEVEQACSQVMNLIKSSGVEEIIRSVIEPNMRSLFGSSRNENNLRFAVRSSGTLEDASDLSCAGQNETFLGVKEESIPEKVLACWASLFTPQSVQYRLNHGQPAVSEMAVVIQEMVDAQAAGVVFSADPRTGNPFEMIINSNFGLGESVVSATCDPDNITLLRSRKKKLSSDTHHSHELTIGNKILGEKKLKVEMGNDGQLAQEVNVSDEEAKKYSITDEIVLRLGKIVLKIEEQLGDFKPIDVEWAVDKNGSIYILQVRHITALDSWTDFEIIHEMDSPLRTNFERNTTANTGEVMPGASSPLSISVVTRILDVAIQSRLFKAYKESIVSHMIRSVSIVRQRILLNVINLMYKNNDKEIGATQVALDLSVFGHRVITDEIHRIGLERFGVKSGKDKLGTLIMHARNIWGSKPDVERLEKKYNDYKIDRDGLGDDSKSIYKNLTEKLFDIFDIAISHCRMSEASGASQMFAFLTLANGKHIDNWDADLYEDVSKIFTVCSDVESADVPKAMDELAETITQSGLLLEEFTESPPPQAFEWLQQNSTLSQALDKFFQKHGHRCIAELDLSRKSWKMDPLPFTQLLQSIVRNKMKAANETWESSAQRTKYMNDDELLDTLKTTLTSGSRRFLKYILFYCRNAVWNRERTKSLFVWTLDQFKPIYQKLGQVMKAEKIIPNDKLIPFMTHQEIGLVISGHPSTHKILYKALRRLKLHPELNKEQFPEISVGMIEPINQDIELEFGDSIQATPLSTGKIQATVKVCMNVEEAAELLEPGDILVTIGTDIGWSPFFPLLGGIVTELGGLISHGAVVAREYGLPCIVGATNATKIFKTGEQVFLDAGKGTLTKVKLDNK